MSLPTAIERWCGRRGSNPHAFRRGILSPLRLPVSPRPRSIVLLTLFDMQGGCSIASHVQCGRDVDGTPSPRRSLHEKPAAVERAGDAMGVIGVKRLPLGCPNIHPGAMLITIRGVRTSVGRWTLSKRELIETLGAELDGGSLRIAKVEDWERADGRLAGGRGAGSPWTCGQRPRVDHMPTGGPESAADRTLGGLIKDNQQTVFQLSCRQKQSRCTGPLQLSLPSFTDKSLRPDCAPAGRRQTAKPRAD